MSEIPPTTTASPDAENPLGLGWQQQDGMLRDLWMQNKTPQDISAILGRSIPAIMTRAARLGLPRRTAPGRKPGSGGTRRLPSADDADPIQDVRRAASKPKKADPPPRELEPHEGLRVCLMCLKKFASEGRHNRICVPCKGSAEYHQASTLSDVHLPNA
jgi:hypothetical protein